MKPHPSAALIVLCAALLGSPAFAAPQASNTKGPTVAVLELHNPAELTPQEAAYVTDLVRWAAVPGGAFVMTRENLQQALPPGTDLAKCEGDCEVETGRNLGADYVASGEIVRYGEGLRVIIKLYDTRTGRLIGAERASGADVEALEDKVDGAARRLFTDLKAMHTESPQALAPPQSPPLSPSLGPSPTSGVVDPLEDDHGFLMVTTTPPGAEVIIDGEARGETPLLLELPTGAHEVLVSRPLYHPVRTPLKLGPDGDELSLALRPSTGRVVLNTRPMGAQVFLDGERVGTTPWSLATVSSGPHVVRVEAPCFATREWAFDLEDGGKAVETLTLERACGRLVVESDPPGAAIVLDGEPTGAVTPYTFQWRAGAVKVTLEREGRGSHTEQITVEAERTARLSARLPVLYGLLSVMAFEPEGAPCQGQVSVDGQRVGAAPWKGRVTAGVHIVEVGCEAGPARGEAQVTAQARAALKLTAEPAPEADPWDHPPRYHTHHGRMPPWHPPVRREVPTTTPHVAHQTGTRTSSIHDGPTLGMGARLDRGRDFYTEMTLWVNARALYVPRLGLNLGLGVHELDARPRGFDDYAVTLGGGLVWALPLDDWLQIFGSASAYGGSVDCDLSGRSVDPESGAQVSNLSLCSRTVKPDNAGRHRVGVGFWALRGGVQFLLDEGLSLDFGLSQVGRMDDNSRLVRTGAGDGFSFALAFLF